jgi:pSer/pThr/pTyr-binding forkhead associated (FHA) protein
MTTCPKCSYSNAVDANFCASCGTRLVSPSELTATITFGATDERGLTEDEAAAVEALPTGQALLVVQRGPGAGNRFLLDKDEVTAGRHPDSDIFLDDVTVSRRHARFVKGRAGYSVSDAGSLNGTYVNRDRIDQVDLRDSDEVQIGKFRLVYLAGPGSDQG